GIFINTADQPALCSFIMPAVLRRGDIGVAISTSGTSPALASLLREKISKIVGPEYAQLAELLSQTRSEIRGRVSSERDRRELHYRILNSDIITMLKANDPAGAERRLRQEHIQRLMIERAREGKSVCRLKGGDPFVFGRGAEEAFALAEAGIPFEIVPGVSSAIAVPAYAGIPLTHRRHAHSFMVITG